MLPTVDVNRVSSGSGRQTTGFDHYTGLFFYGTAPTVTGKWTQYPGPPIIKAQQMFSSADATAAGIIPNSDNVASTGTYLITTKGNTGDTIEFFATLPQPNGLTKVVSLGLYTALVGDTTIALQGAAIAAIINAGTVTHGWSATFNTATITFIAPKSAGVSLNTGTVYSAVISATFAGTFTQNVIAGTGSQHALWFYQISEFFRKFPTGNLWVGIISASSSFNELKTLQSVAASKLRQTGICDTVASRGSAANITGTLTQINSACNAFQKTAPEIVVYQPNIAAVSDLSTYPDQNTNTAFRVQCVISQDGNAAGALLFVQLGQTIGNIGAKLATIAMSRVSASDAQPIDMFNNSDGVENDIPAFGNGVLSSNVTDTLQAQLDSFRYTFFRKFGDQVVGTYWTGNKCCINNSSQFANVNDNRVIDKISRICYSTYIPLLQGELFFKEDGTLQDYTIVSYEDTGTDKIKADMIIGKGNTPLISGVKVTIDPTQPVRITENLSVGVGYIQNGIARNITINVGPQDSI